MFTHIGIHVCASVNVSAFLHIYTHICVGVHLYSCVYRCVCTCTFVCGYMCEDFCVRIFIGHAHACKCAQLFRRVHLYMCMFLCTRVYMVSGVHVVYAFVYTLNHVLC